jgi:hypothetical protein
MPCRSPGLVLPAGSAIEMLAKVSRPISWQNLCPTFRLKFIYLLWNRQSISQCTHHSERKHGVSSLCDNGEVLQSYVRTFYLSQKNPRSITPTVFKRIAGQSLAYRTNERTGLTLCSRTNCRTKPGVQNEWMHGVNTMLSHKLSDKAWRTERMNARGQHYALSQIVVTGADKL